MKPKHQCGHKVPQAYFSTVLIPNQFYGEVPPDFVHHFHHSLQNTWQIFDEFGGEQTFTFNKSHRIPYLTGGWFPLLTQYQITQAKEIHFSYYGNNTFHIHVGAVLASTNDYRSFHSYSTQPLLTTHFDVVLSQYTANSSQLVVR
ncbi:hypothetical protein QL285_050549 [Trifolium repens]|nr:hypothetical protein QL285_050549 [Trifolium repens]